MVAWRLNPEGCQTGTNHLDSFQYKKKQTNESLVVATICSTQYTIYERKSDFNSASNQSINFSKDSLD